MNFPAAVLLLFPAFMVGAAFGILLVLSLAGAEGLKDLRPVTFSIVGSLAGLVVFWLTRNWWPPLVGPFVVCPVLAASAAVIVRRKS